MAKEEKVSTIVREAGYEPLDDRCIIVAFAPKNLSDKVAKFLGANEFYVLQMCQHEIVLIPFSGKTGSVKKQIDLAMPYDSIKSVAVTEDGFDYLIDIETADGPVTLSTQQKELAIWRTSGVLSATNWSGTKNWHKDNLDATLAALKKLSTSPIFDA